MTLLTFHTIQLFAFGLHFESKKPTKNPSKTRSEPIQNRDPKKHAILHRFLLDFSDFCYLRFLENMRFASTGARFLRFSLKSCFCNFHACLVQKINQKSFQNEVRTHPKSMQNTSRFLTSIFWGSGLDFDGFWRGFWERFGGLGGFLGRLFGRR